MSTGDAAAAFLSGQRGAHERAVAQRKDLWDELLAVFRSDRPDEGQLGRVSTVAEVAIASVFDAHRLSAAQCQEQHGAVKDFADCSALYGYVLGMHDARVAIARALGSVMPPTPQTGD